MKYVRFENAYITVDLVAPPIRLAELRERNHIFCNLDTSSQQLILIKALRFRLLEIFHEPRPFRKDVFRDGGFPIFILRAVGITIINVRLAEKLLNLSVDFKHRCIVKTLPFDWRL